MSKDGIPMVFHSASLEETTNATGPFAALDRKQLQALDAGSWFSSAFAGARIPTLEEVLRAARGRGRLYLDVKAERIARPIAEVYRRLGVGQDQSFVAAWTSTQLEDFRLEMPGARVLSVDESPLARDTAFLQRLPSLGFWGMKFYLGEYSAGFVGNAMSYGVPIFVYTANDEPTMARLIEAGVSGIETDDPGLLVKVLERMGARVPR